jgi:biopolymer transport protein ExbD
MQTSKRAQVFNEINITPLTDIFLVLLIIMMVVAPMIQHMRADISPPKMENGAAVAQGPLTVEITKEGDFYVEGAKTEQSTLKELLIEKAKNGKEKNVIIRADKLTKSGAVMKVFEAARDAQYEKVTVAGEPLSDNRQQELQKPTNTSTEAP